MGLTGCYKMAVFYILLILLSYHFPPLVGALNPTGVGEFNDGPYTLL